MYTEACESYFGNVCTGFGGHTRCDICGFDMYEHEPYKSELEETVRWFNEGGNGKTLD